MVRFPDHSLYRGWVLFGPDVKPNTEVTVEKIDDAISSCRKGGYHEDFNVFVEDKRILSIFSDDDLFAAKWFSEAHKACRKHKKSSSSPVVVGLSVDREIRYRKGGIRDDGYDSLTLCVGGSNCLVYTPPEISDWRTAPRAVKEFFADPNVMFVGMDMGEVGERLEKQHEIKIGRSGDVRALAVKRMKEEAEDKAARREIEKKGKGMSLDDVAKQLWNKKMDVERPEYWKPEMMVRTYDYQARKYHPHLYSVCWEYMKYQTLDAFLCYEMGMKYLEELSKLSSSCSSSSA